MRRRTRTSVLIVCCAAVGVLAACASTPNSGAGTTSTPAMSTVALTGGPSGIGPGDEWCRFTDNGGTYYVNTISRLDNNLSASDGGTPITVPGNDFYGLDLAPRGWTCAAGSRAPRRSPASTPWSPCTPEALPPMLPRCGPDATPKAVTTNPEIAATIRLHP